MSKPKKHPGGRPKLPPGVKRIHFSTSIHPDTKKMFDAACAGGKSIGRLLDDLAGTKQ